MFWLSHIQRYQLVSNNKRNCCKILKGNGFQFEYQIIGAKGTEELEFLIKSNNLQNEVFLTVKKPFGEVQQLIKNADLLLLPSFEEGIANVVLEAMQLGTIVLSTNCGGMEEVIENWEAIKAKEKGRTSSLDGIAMAQPALPLVEKLIYRAEKYKVELPMADVESSSQQLQSAPSEETVGQALASIIALAHQHGIDPESSLRGHARAMIEKIRQSEAG